VTDHEPKGSSSGLAELLTRSTALRLFLIAVLVLLLLIPLAMVRSIVAERNRAYRSVLDEIATHWGGEQVLTGPVLVVPFTEQHEVSETKIDRFGNTQTVRRQVTSDRHAVVLPWQLELRGELRPEYRRRSLYESLVYQQELRLAGAFRDVEAQVRSLSEPSRLQRIGWDKALVVVGLSDTKGIARARSLRFGDAEVALAPGTGVPKLLASGFHAPLASGPISATRFELELQVNGSQGFRLAPLGETTEMHLASTWAHPSFYGDLLPTAHEIEAGGFEARWSIPHLARSYPQSWVLEDGSHSLDAFSAGVRLFEPVTLYTEATRAAKHGFLFIALTFLTLVLMELVARARPSMVQYALIGAALALFYLLLIAFSEHLGFNLAYVLAAASVVVLVGLYCLAVLGRRSLALTVMAVLVALYGVLFVILRAEDHALLAGSLLLLVALATTMFFTRDLHRGEPAG